jgi:hypothetical protein
VPYITNVLDIDACMTLPDMVCGPTSEPGKNDLPYRRLVATRDPMDLLNGLSEHFYSRDDSMWHFAADLALNTSRFGDCAGIALGRISHTEVERGVDPQHHRYERIVQTFDFPLIAQITAPVGEQIYLGSIVQLVLLLKQHLGFNITSFSMDGFQSAQSMQQLAAAGLVTKGLKIEDDGSITGAPKAYSVDGLSTRPYREVLEAMAERRINLPKYAILRKELRELERPDFKRAPDHPASGSKDTTDALAQTVGYLSEFGHQALVNPADLPMLTRDDLIGGQGQDTGFGVQDPAGDGFGDDNGEWGSTMSFGVE